MEKILIVDDSRTSRRILRELLEEAGYKVIGEAVNGEEAYSKYVELKPDLMTLDITMPVLDGIEALKIIKKDFPDAKIIMVTAAGQKSKMLECIKYGASEFVAKPYSKEQLIGSIKKLV